MEITKLCNLAVTPVTSTEGRSGTRVPCGDAAPGPAMNSQEHQASFLLPEYEEGLRMRAEGVRGGVQYEQTWKQCSNKSEKYKRFYKKIIILFLEPFTTFLKYEGGEGF